VQRPKGAASNIVAATESELRRWICQGGQTPATQYPAADPELVLRLADMVQQLEVMHRRLELAINRIENCFTQFETLMRSKSQEKARRAR
jgi:hypothetical protein